MTTRQGETEISNRSMSLRVQSIPIWPESVDCFGWTRSPKDPVL